MSQASRRFSERDRAHMARAIELAHSARGPASPNPAVGCVLVRDGRAVAEAATEPYGGAHAEAAALRRAGEAAQGATAYVSLMPCAHRGKTPPCAQALAAAGVSRVVAAVADPHPVSLDGAAVLRAAGVDVDVGCLEARALEAVAGYVKHLRTGLPLVRLKYAMTLDGKLATRTGHSAWISGPAARAEVQDLRAHHDAVLVGVGTVLADDPRLNVRDAQRWQPRRVIADSSCRTPTRARLFAEPGGPVVVLATGRALASRRAALRAAGAELVCVSHGPRLDLRKAFAALGDLGVREVLCEGGAQLAGALFDAGLVDEVIAYVAPKLVGGAHAPPPVAGRGVAAMSEALDLWNVRVRRVAEDVCVRGRVGDWAWLHGGKAGGQ